MTTLHEAATMMLFELGDPEQNGRRKGDEDDLCIDRAFSACREHPELEHIPLILSDDSRVDKEIDGILDLLRNIVTT